MTRFLGRLLTGAGFIVLGADLLASLEVMAPAPRTLGEAVSGGLAAADGTVLVAAVFGEGMRIGPLADLPLSLVLLWLGAMFLLAGRTRKSAAATTPDSDSKAPETAAPHG